MRRTTENMGLWFPEDGIAAGAVAGYLHLIGTLLRDGHFDEAKRKAIEIRPSLPSHTRLVLGSELCR